MRDIDDIIDKIIDEIAQKSSRHFEDNIYTDEPIIFSASKMDNYLPPKYREMREIAIKADYYSTTPASVFYEQAKFMEDHEDDFDFAGQFIRSFPKYQDMNDRQLRGYFSWRTKLRKGDIQKTSLSFAYVYCYELLNGIGAKDALDGYNKLYSFCEAYSRLDVKFINYHTQWLNDYIVYNDLDKALLDDVRDSYFDECLGVISNPESVGDDELFTALDSLSSYHFNKSKAYKTAPEDMKRLTCGVFRALSDYYANNRKKTYAETVFGKVMSGPYIMFKAAVFYDRKKYTDYTYKVNDVLKYTCREGKWSCEQFFGSRTPNKELGILFKNIDNVMRKKLGVKPELKNVVENKLVTDLITAELESLENLRKKERLDSISIDLSKLDNIRNAADITRDKLIVEETDQDLLGENISPIPRASEPEKEEQKAEENRAEAFKTVNNTVLSGNEFYLLHCLLTGAEYKDTLRKKGLMVSVLVDSINEALFDEFGDTVIDFNGDTPKVIEDYLEDLKGLCKV